MTLFFVKWSRLVTIRNPDKKVRFSNGPVFRMIQLFKNWIVMDYLNTRLVQFSDVQFTYLKFTFVHSHVYKVK
jgi:hypothetical protein